MDIRLFPGDFLELWYAASLLCEIRALGECCENLGLSKRQTDLGLIL